VKIIVSIFTQLKIIALGLLLLLCGTSFGQLETKGREFWGTVNASWPSTDSVVIFVSSEEPTSVSLTVFSTGTTITKSILANTQYRIAVDRPQVLTSTYFTNAVKSFRITSTKDISAYLLVPASYTTDATVLYPSKAISNNSKYLLLTYDGSTSIGTRNCVIVSHANNTIVEFTFKGKSSSVGRDSIILDTLDLGECYQIKDLYDFRLSGGTARVLNGKKISTFCGNRCTMAACTACDMLLEQVPPLETLGTKYLIVPLKGHTNGYIIQVTTNTDNTALIKDGSLVVTLQKGDVYEYDVNSERAICLTANNPILVSQIMKGITCNGSGSGDPGLVFLSSSDQLIQSALVATANTTIISQHFISLVIPKKGIDSMYIDGVLIPRSKFVASNCGDFYWYTDTLQAGNHLVYNYFGFLAYIYGTGSAESYLYTAGSGLRNLNMEIAYESFPLCDSGRVYFFNPSDSSSTYYEWIWDDGSPPDSGLTAVHAFYDTDEHFVRLAYASNSSGQIDTAYQLIKISGDAELNLITQDDINACTDSTYEINAKNIPTFRYLWNTGDTVASITISDPGTYTLIATDSITGCTAYDTTNVLFFKDVKADFTLPSSTLCGNTNIALLENVTVDASTDSIIQYRWFIDYQFTRDSKTDTLFNAAPNNYDIELKVLSNNGCRDSITKRITVSDTPTIEYDVSILDKCFNYNLVQFRDFSYASFGTLDTTYWVFSNGDTAQDKSLLKHFDTSGDMWVDLIVKTNEGCINSKRINFRIEPSPTHGMIAIDSVPCSTSNRFQFRSLHESTEPSLYLWYWGDGSSTGYTKPTSNGWHYMDTGAYEVTLTAAYTITGCSDTTTQTVRVIDENPIAKLIMDSFDYCLKGNFISLTDVSTVPSFFDYTRKWQVDTGVLSTDSIATLSFDSTSIYNINLVILTTEGCTDTATKKFTVFPSNDAAFNITDSFNCLNGNYFTVENLDPLVDARFRWEQSDGTIIRGLADSVTLDFATPGTYTITLKTETFLYACKDSFERTVTVYPNIAANLLLTDTSRCVTNNQFIAQDITNYQGSPAHNQWTVNGSIVQIDTVDITQHFNTTGPQTIELISGTQSSCPDTAVITALVENNIESSLQLSDSAQCLSGNLFDISLVKVSQDDSIIKYDWHLSDGNTSTLASPEITYTQSGVKTIEVFILTQLGCKDTLNNSVTVFPQLIPSIASIDTVECLNTNLFSFDYSPSTDQDSIQSILWQFDDGLTSQQFYPEDITYSTSGLKNIQVNTITDHGCQDSATYQVTVLDNPVASFSTDTVCYGDQSTAISTSSPASTIDSYAWEVDGQPTPGDQTMQTTMQASGLYDVRLAVSNTDGCTDTATQLASIMVLDPPTADFTYLLFPQNTGSLTVTFKDASSSDIVFREWRFPGNRLDNTADPTINFIQKGTLDIVLYVENIAGCSDTALRTINFQPPIKVLIPSGFTPTKDGLNDGFGPALIERNTNYNMQIFNRWGELLFETNDFTKKWDGTYMGEPCPQGVYMYVIGYINEFSYQAVKGTVTLLR
jgi:gliding motility-associated-like protein